MDPKISFLAFHLMFLLGVATSATFISDHGAFQSQGSIGRNLLQAKKNCPVSFEFADYTIITSKCKGPNYPVDKCCPAFKEFACPYADYINDGTNDCASTMFSYITTKGNYPAGLFGSECREGKEGLACPADAPNSTDTADTHRNDCPVSFEFADYTIITSKCKGPNYPVDKCCPVFKEFACPYADYINDGTNDCACTMFSYITTKGNYPVGLFRSECREGKEGLACPADAQNSTDNANAGHVARSFVPVTTLVSGFLLAFLSS